VSRFAAWLPAIGWAALLFLLSSRPSLPAPDVANLDKAAHFAAYAVMGLLLAFAADRSRWPLWIAVALGAAYGASDEIHQMFVPGRSASVLDWLADAAGTLAAVVLYARWRAPRRSPEPEALRA
jgi:VanZ family protein